MSVRGTWAQGRSVGRGFTLAEALIASVFVAIALTGVLAMAPALISGQQELALRARADAAAVELLALFDEAAMNEAAGELATEPGTGGGAVGGVLALLQGVVGQTLEALSGTEADPIVESNDATLWTTSLRGFVGTVRVAPVDPVTLAESDASSPAALIEIELTRGARPVAMLRTIRTDEWLAAVQRRGE